MKTQLEVYTVAVDAAKSSLALKSKLEVDTFKLNQANVAGVPAEQYEFYAAQFEGQRDFMLHLGTQNIEPAAKKPEAKAKNQN